MASRIGSSSHDLYYIFSRNLHADQMTGPRGPAPSRGTPDVSVVILCHMKSIWLSPVAVKASACVGGEQSEE